MEKSPEILYIVFALADLHIKGEWTIDFGRGLHSLSALPVHSFFIYCMWLTVQQEEAAQRDIITLITFFCTDNDEFVFSSDIHVWFALVVCKTTYELLKVRRGNSKARERDVFWSKSMINIE